MTTPTRIVVADDHPVVREGLVIMIGTQPDFEVVGEAASGQETVERVQALLPDVVLLDLEMPEMDGLEALRRLHDLCPNVRVLVFTAFDTDDRIVGAVQAGAKGYLLKGAPRGEIFNAIRIIHQGGSLLEPVVASKLLQHITNQNDTHNDADNLTEREADVLYLLAQGKMNKEIAASLVITERTVKFHISSILAKLGAGNRTEAVRIAAQRGLVNLTDDEKE